MDDSSAPKEKLDRRYAIELNFPNADVGDPLNWDTINSFATPIEALRGCSECVEVVKLLKEVPYGSDLPGTLIRLRVRDTTTQRLVVWEGEDGEICWDDEGFAPGET